MKVKDLVVNGTNADSGWVKVKISDNAEEGTITIRPTSVVVYDDAKTPYPVSGFECGKASDRFKGFQKAFRFFITVFDGNGLVGMEDLMTFISFYNMTIDDPEDTRYESFLLWKELCDMDGDGVVSLSDALELITAYTNSQKAIVRSAVLRGVPNSVTFKLVEKDGRTNLAVGDIAVIQVLVKTNMASGLNGAMTALNFAGMEFEGEFNPDQIVKHFVSFVRPSAILDGDAHAIYSLGGVELTADPACHDNYIVLAEFPMTMTAAGTASISIRTGMVVLPGASGESIATDANGNTSDPSRSNVMSTFF